MTVSNIKNKVQLTLDLAFFKQALKLLSLEQMQLMVAFLNTEVQKKIEAQRNDKEEAQYRVPSVSLDSFDIWEGAKEEPEVSEEAFNKAVQELS